MAVEVEFITLGDASEKLGIPAGTLRHWTDQLEEYEVHYTKRNNRNERIYYDTDLDIFEFLRDLKSEHGRRTTTRDLAYIIREKAKTDDMFELRTREDAPIPQNSNRTSELLGQEDIQRLMQSERVRQFMEVITRNVRDEVVASIQEENRVNREALKEEVRQEIVMSHGMIEEGLKDVYLKLEEDLKKREERQKEREEQLSKFVEDITNRQKERDEKLTQAMRDMMESKKGFFARLFGK